MSFDYDKLRGKEEEANWWTAYADLWSMLAIVFLMMFVATSLRSGTQGLQQQIEYGDLQKKNSELQEQLKVYSNLRDDTLQAGGKQEQEVYKKLMSKLSLLQEEAKDEKEQLRRKAKDNEDKEFALNEYQQIVRNIIDSNILSKSQIKRRDQIIVDKKQTIQELNKAVREREETIQENESEIAQIDNKLNQQIQKLQVEQKRAKLTKQQMASAVQRLKSDSQKKIAALNAESQEARDQLKGELEQTRANYVAEMDNLKSEHEAKLAGERAAFENQLNKERLGADERAARLAAFKKAAEEKARGLEGELAGLAGKIRDTESQLGNAKNQLGSARAELGDAKEKLGNMQGQLGNVKGQLGAVQGELGATRAQLGAAEAAKGKLAGQNRALAQEKQVLSGDLARAQELINTKKKLIEQIQRNLAKSGVKASVNGKTGDVTVDFGDEYFDTGSADLKPGMIRSLDKFIPTYAATLFQDGKVAENIANIEIIGFASSTYKGRYVKPTSLKPSNQDAINYNLKLSFTRANAIFRHIFNPAKLQFSSQKKLLPLVKVVGRGFLPEGLKEDEVPEDMPEAQFCAKYKCNKAQRVIVKFNLKE